MARFILILLLLSTSLPVLMAQADTVVTRSLMASSEALMMPKSGPILDAETLESKRVYHSVEEALSDPMNVYKLSLSDKKLKELPEAMFRLVNLQVLNLGDNKLSTLPENISKLQNLQVLVLTNNRINTLPNSLKDLDHLTHLYMGRNRMMEMPAWVGGLSKLDYLDVSHNHLTLYDIERASDRLRHCEIIY